MRKKRMYKPVYILSNNSLFGAKNAESAVKNIDNFLDTFCPEGFFSAI